MSRNRRKSTQDRGHRPCLASLDIPTPQRCMLRPSACLIRPPACQTRPPDYLGKRRKTVPRNTQEQSASQFPLDHPVKSPKNKFNKDYFALSPCNSENCRIYSRSPSLCDSCENVDTIGIRTDCLRPYKQQESGSKPSKDNAHSSNTSSRKESIRDVYNRSQQCPFSYTNPVSRKFNNANVVEEDNLQRQNLMGKECLKDCQQKCDSYGFANKEMIFDPTYISNSQTKNTSKHLDNSELNIPNVGEPSSEGYSYKDIDYIPNTRNVNRNRNQVRDLPGTKIPNTIGIPASQGYSDEDTDNLSKAQNVSINWNGERDSPVSDIKNTVRVPSNEHYSFEDPNNISNVQNIDRTWYELRDSAGPNIPEAIDVKTFEGYNDEDADNISKAHNVNSNRSQVRDSAVPNILNTVGVPTSEHDSDNDADNISKAQNINKNCNKVRDSAGLILQNTDLPPQKSLRESDTNNISNVQNINRNSARVRDSARHNAQNVGLPTSEFYSDNIEVPKPIRIDNRGNDSARPYYQNNIGLPTYEGYPNEYQDNISNESDETENRISASNRYNIQNTVGVPIPEENHYENNVRDDMNDIQIPQSEYLAQDLKRPTSAEHANSDSDNSSSWHTLPCCQPGYFHEQSIKFHSTAIEDNVQQTPGGFYDKQQSSVSKSTKNNNIFGGVEYGSKQPHAARQSLKESKIIPNHDLCERCCGPFCDEKPSRPNIVRENAEYDNNQDLLLKRQYNQRYSRENMNADDYEQYEEGSLKNHSSVRYKSGVNIPLTTPMQENFINPLDCETGYQKHSKSSRMKSLTYFPDQNTRNKFDKSIPTNSRKQFSKCCPHGISKVLKATQEPVAADDAVSMVDKLERSCACIYPPAFKQLSCTGNINGTCSCSQHSK